MKKFIALLTKGKGKTAMNEWKKKMTLSFFELYTV